MEAWHKRERKRSGGTEGGRGSSRGRSRHIERLKIDEESHLRSIVYEEALLEEACNQACCNLEEGARRWDLGGPDSEIIDNEP